MSSVPRLHWGLVVLLGRFQDPCRCHRNIIDTAFCLACIWSKEISAVSGQQIETAAMLLCKRHNDSGAGFPRGDGRLPSLPEPTLREANRDSQPIRGCASIRFVGLQRPPPADFVVGCRCARRLVSTPSGGLSLWRFNAAGSRRAFNRCSFSWLVSRDHLAVSLSRMALKRCSLSLELSLDTLTAARLR